MGSVKKKVNKVFNKAADKLIPKELAPFLPYASMLLPFVGGPMAGIMGSTLGRYAVPQMLTALGSAKTTGEVDLKKQALAAASSYLGGPGDESATNMEKAYLKQNPNAATSTTSAGVPNAISGANGPVNTTFQDFTKIDPDALDKFAKTYKPTGNAFLSNTQDYGMGLQRAAGGSEGFLKQASLIGSPMLTMGGIDLAEKTIREQKEDIANRKMGIKKYMDSADDLSEYYRDLAPDYDQLYGGLDFAKRFMNQGGRVGYNAGSLVSSSGVSSDRMNELIKFAMDDGASIQEAFEYAKRMAAGETQLNQGGRVGMNTGGSPSMSDMLNNSLGGKDSSGLNKLFLLDALSNFQGSDGVMSLLGPLLGMNKGGRVGMNHGGSAENATNQFQMKLAELLEVGVPLEEAEKQAMDFMQRAFKGLGGGYADGGRIGLDEGGFLSNILGDSTVDDIQRGIVSFLGGGSLLETGMSEYDEAYEEMLDAGISEEEALDMRGPRPGLTMDKDKEKQANGGRVGLNMGGMGSIPQTPMVPQGQQLDGRGGGFIPMGAQEKKDDVPAMLAKNEFVMTSDAVRAAGGGSIQKGAQRMYDIMNQLEAQV